MCNAVWRYNTSLRNPKPNPDPNPTLPNYPDIMGEFREQQPVNVIICP